MQKLPAAHPKDYPEHLKVLRACQESGERTSEYRVVLPASTRGHPQRKHGVLEQQPPDTLPCRALALLYQEGLTCLCTFRPYSQAIFVLR